MSNRPWIVALLVLVLSCKADGEAQPPVEATVDQVACTDLTWANFGQPFFNTWCTGCHSSWLPEELRGGAPEGIDFDALESVKQWAGPIAPAVYGPTPTMPPAGPVPEELRAHLEEWITCGMPGEDPVIESAFSCASPVVVGAITASDGSPCSGEGIAIDGDLVVDSDVDLSCVCEVTGSVRLEDGAAQAALPELRTVGAGFTAAASTLQSLDLPELQTVEGDLRLEGLGTVAAFDLDALVSVGGDFVVADAANLESFALPRLESVGGNLSVVNLPVLQDIANFTGVKGTIGGNVTLSDLPQYRGAAYGGWSALLRVEAVSGSITIERTGFPQIWGFQETSVVGGAVVIRENENLEVIGGFHELEEVGSRILIEDNPVLVSFIQMPLLVSVGAAAEYPDAGIFLRNNPVLSQLDPFPNVADLEAFELVGCHALEALTGFSDGQLRGLPGGLRIVDNGALRFIGAFPVVASTGPFEVRNTPSLELLNLPGLVRTTDFAVADSGLGDFSGFEELSVVEGDFTIDSNPQLTSLAGLFTVEWVKGSVRLTDNPLLPTVAAEALADSIPTIDGTVTVSGNQP